MVESLSSYVYNHMDPKRRGAWMRGLNRQRRYAGQTIDYTQWPLGRGMSGGRVRICPNCHRRGLEQGDKLNRGFIYEFTHKLHVINGFASEPLDTCTRETLQGPWKWEVKA